VCSSDLAWTCSSAAAPCAARCCACSARAGRARSRSGASCRRWVEWRLPSRLSCSCSVPHHSLAPLARTVMYNMLPPAMLPAPAAGGQADWHCVPLRHHAAGKAAAAACTNSRPCYTRSLQRSRQPPQCATFGAAPPPPSAPDKSPSTCKPYHRPSKRWPTRRWPVATASGTQRLSAGAWWKSEAAISCTT